MKNKDIEGAALAMAIDSFASEVERGGYVDTSMIVQRAEEFASFLRSNRVGPTIKTTTADNMLAAAAHINDGNAAKATQAYFLNGLPAGPVSHWQGYDLTDCEVCRGIAAGLEADDNGVKICPACRYAYDVPVAVAD